MRTIAIVVTALAVLGRRLPAQVTPELRHVVFAAESSFAASMANRDLAAFTRFLSPEAIFFGGPSPARGRDGVVAAWRRFFEGEAAPFSWRPETVEVLPSGNLALTSGPVFDPGGKQTGIFNSIWRREPDGRWLVVFDKGCPSPPKR